MPPTALPLPFFSLFSATVFGIDCPTIDGGANLLFNIFLSSAVVVETEAALDCSEAGFTTFIFVVLVVFIHIKPQKAAPGSPINMQKNRNNELKLRALRETKNFGREPQIARELQIALTNKEPVVDTTLVQ